MSRASLCFSTLDFNSHKFKRSRISHPIVSFLFTIMVSVLSPVCALSPARLVQAVSSPGDNAAMTLSQRLVATLATADHSSAFRVKIFDTCSPTYHSTNAPPRASGNMMTFVSKVISAMCCSVGGSSRHHSQEVYSIDHDGPFSNLGGSPWGLRSLW